MVVHWPLELVDWRRGLSKLLTCCWLGMETREKLFIEGSADKGDDDIGDG